MQEEVTQRTVALCVEATKLSAGMLQQAMKKVLDEMQKGVTGHKSRLHHGKQTLRQLMKHNTGVSNIEITDQNIRAGMPMLSRQPSGSSPQRTWRKRKSPLSARNWTRRNSSPKPSTASGRRSRPKTGVWNYDRHLEKSSYPQPSISAVRISL